MLRVRACFEAGGTFNLEPSSPQPGRLLLGVESVNGVAAVGVDGRMVISGDFGNYGKQ